MIKSMTGFGKAHADFTDKTITVEIRSLNSKQFDLNLRVPSIYREKDVEVRGEVQRQMERGKIDLSIYIEYRNEKPTASFNREIIAEYHQQLIKIADEIGENKLGLLPLLINLPESIKQDKKELNESEWKETVKVIHEALKNLNKFRSDEGNSLEAEFKKRIHEIEIRLQKIESIDQNRIENIKKRIRNNLQEFIPIEKIDANRFEQELIYYLEKLDVTEEKVRLKTHLNYFLATLHEPSCGRKLNFISQEIGREINTIGSKANDAEIQVLVVEMKDELERIKEQSLNIL